MNVRSSLRVALYNALSFWAGAVLVASIVRDRPYCAVIALAMVPWTIFWSCLTTGLFSCEPRMRADPAKSAGDVLDIFSGKRR